MVNVSNENEEERDEKRRRKERKKRTKRELLEEDVMVWFLWRLSISLVKGEFWRLVVVFIGGTF